jgi:uncharacterized protein (TIGR02588 family)
MTKARAGISKWEWVAASLSGAMVVAAIVILALHGRRTQTPPDLTITVDRIVPVSAGYLATFTVHNSGGETAAAVIVEGVLVKDGDVEQSEVMFDYVPDGSLQRGGLMFTRNPEGGELTVRAHGYREP